VQGKCGFENLTTNHMNIRYSLIIFQERGAGSLPGSGWLALVDACFDMAASEIQPYVAGQSVRPRSR
jgi:hypothetical protein